MTFPYSISNKLHSIHHDGSRRYVRPNKPGQLHIGDEVHIHLRMAPDVPIQRVLLRTAPDGEQQFAEMQPVGGNSAVWWWQAVLRISMPVVNYRFLLFTKDGAWWYNGSSLHWDVPADHEDFRLLADYTAPTWVRQSVFYQIFPDRFANGDPRNDVRNGEYVYFNHPAKDRPWGEPPSSGGGAAMVEFFGGDLPGVESRLDYLEDLGINALYFNPIFSAYSNHRYDVVDYEQVDPHLGGNQALVSFRQAAARRDMRFILDIVPNHCGVLHSWFQRAQADPSAPEAEFFTFHQHPEEYESWLSIRSLPKLNYRSQRLREVMYAGANSIFRRWLRPPYSADGWRLDVANMLGRQGANQLGLEVGRGIRLAVKEENPEAYLLGENFFDATSQLQGDMWDAVMNYAGFMKPLTFWLSGFYINQHVEPRQVKSPVPWSTQAMTDTWKTFRAAIPWEIAAQQFNLLGSHDTPRILDIVGGNRGLARLAVGLLMTYVGIPCVYYGDEIGLGGNSRQCMPWQPESWDNDMRSFYQNLIQLRRSSPALMEGGFQLLLVEDDSLAYLRDTDEEQIIVVANRSATPRLAGPLMVMQAGIEDGTEFVEEIHGNRAVISAGRLPLPELPTGVQIWRSVSRT